MRRAIEVTIQFYDERRDLLRLIATEEPRLAEARNRLIQSWRERGFVFFTSLIEEGMRTGVFGHTDSRAATLAILGGIRSVLLYYGAEHPAQSISQELGDFYLKGLIARGAAIQSSGRASAVRKIIRRIITLMILTGLGYGFYWFGNIFLWPPPDRSTIRAVGMVEAPEVNITSRIAGRITDLKLLEGDRVTRGQVICRIEDIDIRNELRKAEADLLQAQANMMNAKRTIDRDERLFAQHVIAAKDRDDARTAYDQAVASVASNKANVDFYKDQLKDTAIVSPVDGVVVNKALEVGEWVTPGTPILTIDDLTTIWARVDVQETDLGSIYVGKAAQVVLPTDPPVTFSGRVMAIGQEGNFATERDVRRGPAGYPDILCQGAGAAGRRRIETRHDRRSIIRAASRWNQAQPQ